MSGLSASQEAFLRELGNTSIPVSWTADSSDLGYPRTLFWNHGIDHLPLAIIEPRSRDDIQQALKLAGAHDVTVGVVNAGGHDSSGRAISSGKLCIDLSKHFRNVTFDRAAMEVRVGGGCNFNDIVPHLPMGYEISIGNIKSVGVTGLYTGGGFGYITHVVGLGVDLLLGATVVLADGSIVECSDTQREDLMWCLRGGGGGFGVITELRIKVIELPKMLHASITWPLTEREAVQEAFKTYQDLLDECPGQISVFGRVSTIPHVGPGLGLMVTFHGPRDAADAAIDRLTRIPHTQVLKRDWMHFKDMLDPMAERAAPRGGYYYSVPRSFFRITPATVDSIIDAHLADPSGKCILYDVHGKPCLRKVEETAFPMRTPHRTFFIVGSCGLMGDKATPERRKQSVKWATDLGETLRGQENAIPGGHPNLLLPGDVKGLEQWYGPNAEKLRGMRKKLDPEGRFRGATGDMSSPVRA